MKYFTPELHQRLQDFHDDEAMDAADEAWDKARMSYRRYYRRIRKGLPIGLQKLLEDHVLHDGDVLGMGGRGKTFVLVLRLPRPPRQLLVAQYRLARPAVIDEEAFASKAAGPAQWLYDEVNTEDDVIVHSVLLSNGWEIRLPLTDVKVVQSDALYPLTDSAVEQLNGRRVSRPA